MTAQNIIITGDFILDNHIYEGQRNDYGDATSLGAHLCRLNLVVRPWCIK